MKYFSFKYMFFLILGCYLMQANPCKAAPDTTTIRVCPRVSAEYVDSGFGETGLNTPKITVPIRGLEYEIYNDKNKRIFVGTTDEEGCTFAQYFAAGQTIQFFFYYTIDDGHNRKANVLPKDTTMWTTHSNVARKVDINVIETVANTTLTYHVEIEQSKYTQILPIADHMLRKADELDWREGQYMAFALDNDHLCKRSDGTPQYGSAYFGLVNFLEDHLPRTVHKICSADENGEAKMKKKVVIAHEMGHAIAKMNDGPLNGDSHADEAGVTRYPYENENDKYCHYGKNGHAYHSREWVGMAAKEGFAQFIAAASFNTRTSSSPIFTYYKPSFNPITGKKTERTTPFSLKPDQNGQWPGWTEKMCKPPENYKHLGSEGDWLNFFWGLWTGPEDVRYSVDDINKLYDKSTDRKKYMDVHCIPISEIKGEEGWTCREFGFSKEVYKRKEDATDYVAPWEIDKIHRSKKYDRGHSWDQIWDTAKDLFDENIDKTEYFLRTSQRAKIIY